MDIRGLLRDVKLLGWAVKYSLWPVHIVTACCGVEFAHVFGPGFDAERHGLLPMPALRHCNLLVVEGTVTLKMAKHLRLVYEQMPDPKYVIALGSCALSCGLFSGSYHVVPADKVLPVDIYVSGCPPLPEAILASFVKLQEKLSNFPLETIPEAPDYRPSPSLFYLERIRELEDGKILLAVGPQHPGSGHFRFFLVLDGDVVVDAYPDPGYVHRGVEKLAEKRHYIAMLPVLERVSLTDPANITLCYVNALEKLLKISPSDRARYIRVVLCELCRVGTHLYDLGILSIFLGHSTGYMWCFGMRELICEVFSHYAGSRHAPTAIIPGGVRYDLTEKHLRLIEKALSHIERKLESFRRIFIENAAVKARLREVGVLTRSDAVKLGVVGPNLRASGVCYDARRVVGYEVYPLLDFEVPVLDEGDCYARTILRLLEIEQSMKIVRQALKSMPSGRIVSEEVLEVARELGVPESKPLAVFARVELPRGFADMRVEGARGLMYMQVVSRGGEASLYRLRVMTPSYYSLRGMMQAMIGYRLADVPAVYGSFGHFPPECDR